MNSLTGGVSCVFPYGHTSSQGGTRPRWWPARRIEQDLGARVCCILLVACIYVFGIKIIYLTHDSGPAHVPSHARCHDHHGQSHDCARSEHPLVELDSVRLHALLCEGRRRHGLGEPIGELQRAHRVLVPRVAEHGCLRALVEEVVGGAVPRAGGPEDVPVPLQALLRGVWGDDACLWRDAVDAAVVAVEHLVRPAPHAEIGQLRSGGRTHCSRLAQGEGARDVALVVGAALPRARLRELCVRRDARAREAVRAVVGRCGAQPARAAPSGTELAGVRGGQCMSRETRQRAVCPAPQAPGGGLGTVLALRVRPRRALLREVAPATRGAGEAHGIHGVCPGQQVLPREVARNRSVRHAGLECGEHARRTPLRARGGVVEATLARKDPVGRLGVRARHALAAAAPREEVAHAARAGVAEDARVAGGAPDVGCT